jgi:DNA-binding HxlR family transcriptional regulator
MRKPTARGYGQFCPVAKTAEIFAQRWTPLIARELCFGPKRFSDIHGAMPLMSRSLLARRLDELEAAGLIATAPSGTAHVYGLTEAGQGLTPVIEAMSAWGQRWSRGAIPDDELDPGSLMWGMRRQIELATVPEEGMVIRFSFRGLPTAKASLRHWWLVLARHDVEVCQKDPGLHVDVVVEADLRAFTEWCDIRTGSRGQAGTPRARAYRNPGSQGTRFPAACLTAAAGTVTRAVQRRIRRWTRKSGRRRRSMRYLTPNTTAACPMRSAR